MRYSVWTPWTNAPGESVTTPPLAAGEHKFLCLIHPWMRVTVTAD